MCFVFMKKIVIFEWNKLVIFKAVIAFYVIFRSVCKMAKKTISFIMTVCLSVCLTECRSVRPL